MSPCVYKRFLQHIYWTGKFFVGVLNDETSVPCVMFEVYTRCFLDFVKCPSMKCFDNTTSQHSLLEKTCCLCAGDCG